MGHIQRRGPGRYKARYRDPANTERSKTFARRVDAERWLTQQESAKNRGEWTDPRLARTCFGDWEPSVSAGRVDLRESTQSRDASLMRNLVLPHFQDHPLGSVLPADIQAWIANLIASEYSPSTVRKAFQLAAGVFSSAVDSGLISRSPCRNIRLPREIRTEMRFLDPSEIADLSAAIGPRFRTLTVTAAYSGLRWGELAALRLEDVNLLRRQITVTRTLSEVRGHIRFTEPKTKAAWRTVAIPPTVAQQIGQHIGRYPARDNLVFSSDQGGPLRRTNFRQRQWLPAVRASVGEPCRFHDLRHSHVSLLINAGEHPKTIASRLGHTSVRTVLDVYGHLFEGLDEAAADRLEAVFLHHLAASPRPGA